MEEKKIIYDILTNIICWCIQDPKTNNWWLTNENERIGYFPASLFTNLSSADQVGWGGRTTSTSALSPPMGSGFFPNKVFDHAGYFIQVTFHNGSRKDYGPSPYLTNDYSDKLKCYSAEYYGDLGGEIGCSLQFGGPGGSCGN